MDAAVRTKTPGEDPLYVRVARTLKDEIIGGVFPVGAQIPTEEALVARFAVSRHTVRAALRKLRDDGLIASRRRLGTVVVQPRRDRRVIQAATINDLVTYSANTRFEVESMGMETLGEARAAILGVEAGETWFHICGFGSTGDETVPFCRAEYFIRPEFAGVGRILPHHAGAVFLLIEDMYGQTIAEVEQDITGGTISPKVAAGLQVDVGAASMEVRRIYRTLENFVVQVTLEIQPASRFRYSTTMRRVKA